METIITMTHGIEDSFPNGLFVKGLDIPDKQPFLIMLNFVAKVDCLPQLVVEQKKSFPEFLPLLKLYRRLAGPIFEHDF
jgi:hypothetical protein